VSEPEAPLSWNGISSPKSDDYTKNQFIYNTPKCNGNRKNSTNKKYLCSQEMGILTRWLQQNGIPFSDQWPKERMAALVAGHYSMATPKPKRRGQWMRPNTTVPKWNGNKKSRLNTKRSASASLGSSFGELSDESLDEIYESEEEEDDDDALMKGLDLSGISVETEVEVTKKKTDEEEKTE